jgi:hypothetical protein
MSTSTFTATEAYYHQTPVGGNVATEWIAGGPRKGVSNGCKEIGIILFDKEAISTAINHQNVPGAKLTLTRDATYGTQPVDISIAPLHYKPNFVAMNYDECVYIAQRYIHHLTTVEGETAVIDIPGYWLSVFQTYEVNGFMIYHEDGEGTDAPARFTANAQLELTIGTEWVQPVWMRSIGAGDVISDETHSHVGDMLELFTYINYRRAVDGLQAIDYPVEHRDAYDEWVEAIHDFREAIDDIYEEEGKTAIAWLQYETGEPPLPKASFINQIRNALEAPVSGGIGTMESMAVMEYARTYFDHLDSDFKVNTGTPTTWSRKGPCSGMNWEYVTDGGTKKKKFNRRFGFWLLKSLLAGKTVNNAKLRLTVNSGNGNNLIRLYPVKISAVPTTRVSVNTVFLNQTEIMGSATATVGQTVDIPLTQDAISKLKTDANYYGVGVDDHDNWKNFDASATLIINDGE